MKKHIKRLICYSLITLVGINFNTEARLPKYMAQRAAELLIKGSNLGIKDEILDPEETKRENLLCLKDIKSLVNTPVGMGIETKKIKGIVNEIIKNIKKQNKEQYISKAIAQSGIKDELCKTIENLLNTKSQKEYKKYETEILEKVKVFIYASKLVSFLYTTKGRQCLCDWFRRAFYKDEYGNICYKELMVNNAQKDLKTLLMALDNVNGNTYLRGDFINWHFPCWTGTLTCFMKNPGSVAYKLLEQNAWNTNETLSKQLKTIFIGNSNLERLINCFFILEIVEDWKDIKELTNTKGNQPSRPNNYDPYECVPVPNTMYYLPNKTPQGSCMVSAIRNLLCILCRDENGEYKKNDSLRNEVDKYIRNFNDTKIRDFIPGTTSPAILGEFAENILPEIKVSYQPTLDLFVCTLNNLLKNKIESSKVVIPTPAEYMYGKKLEIFYQDLIETILRKITGHDEKLSVEKSNNLKKLTHDWPELCLVIRDKVVDKEITIAFGKRGNGEHVEITNINNITQQ